MPCQRTLKMKNPGYVKMESQGTEKAKTTEGRQGQEEDFGEKPDEEESKPNLNVNFTFTKWEQHRSLLKELDMLVPSFDYFIRYTKEFNRQTIFLIQKEHLLLAISFCILHAYQVLDRLQFRYLPDIIKRLPALVLTGKYVFIKKLRITTSRVFCSI